MAKDFKLKLTERIQNKALPKLARLREDNFLECIICKFASIEDLSFKKHYVALPHKKVPI